MTGTEYINLHEGDQCILLEDIGEWHKGDIVEMIYRSKFEESIYFKNICNIINGEPSYGIFQMKTCLRALSLCKKYNEIPVTKTTFEHRFNVGDGIWMMECNEPRSFKIKRLEYIENKKGKGEWSYVCEDNRELDDTFKIYSSKDELLDSLR